VDDISRVQVFYGLEQLIHDILLVNVLQYTASFYHIVQVCIYNVNTMLYNSLDNVIWSELSKTLKYSVARHFDTMYKPQCFT